MEQQLLCDQQIASLRQKVSKTLDDATIKTSIKQALLLSGGSDRIAALQMLKDCGLVDQLIGATAAAAETSAAAATPASYQSSCGADNTLQQPQGSRCCYMHVRVKAGRAFTTYLTRKPLPGEQLQLHLLLHGQRIASAPVPAATSPAFQAEGLIRLPLPPPVAAAAAGSATGDGSSNAGSSDAAATSQAGRDRGHGGIEADLEHLLQLQERLHVVVVATHPAADEAITAPAASRGTAAYAAVAAAAANCCLQQQQQQMAGSSNGSSATAAVWERFGRRRLLHGVGQLDWRKALCRRKDPLITLVELRPDCPDELQSSAVVGAVELHLQLLPQATLAQQALSETVVRLQRQAELRRQSEALGAFVQEAKAWWAAYLAMNPAFKLRNIKVLARCDAGCQHPVSAWLQRLQLGRGIGCAAEAARFVALLGTRHVLEALPGAAAAGASAGCWASLHTMLATRQGSQEELALLLASLLLGFGLDAWVLLGRAAQQSSRHRQQQHLQAQLDGAGVPSCCVLVHHASAPDSSTIWEPLTGLSYGVRDLHSLPLASIDCVFNQQLLLANCQPDSSPAAVSWVLQQQEDWMPLDMRDQQLRQPLERLPCPLQQAVLPAWQVEQELERQIMAGLAAAREQLLGDARLLPLSYAAGGAGGGHGLPDTMRWSPQLAHMLMPALAAYEAESLLGFSPPAASQFAAAIKGAVPDGAVFKGVPLQHNTLSAPLILQALLDMQLVQQLLMLTCPQQQQQQCRWGQQAQQSEAAALGVHNSGVIVADLSYALRVKLTFYPEDVVSLWLMFAAVYLPAAAV